MSSQGCDFSIHLKKKHSCNLLKSKGNSQKIKTEQISPFQQIDDNYRAKICCSCALGTSEVGQLQFPSRIHQNLIRSVRPLVALNRRKSNHLPFLHHQVVALGELEMITRLFGF